MIIKNDLKNTSGIRALSLDIDDTMTHYLPTPQYLADTLDEFNLPYSKDVLLGYFNAIRQFESNVLQTGEFSSDIFIKYLWNNIKILRESDISEVDFKNCLFDKEAFYTKIASGVQEEVALLHHYYRLFCYTKWFREQQQRKLSKHDLLQYIERVYAFEDDSAIKTSQGFETLAINLKHLGINKNEFVHIGDSNIDIEPCESAGIQSILIDYKETKQNLYPMALAVVTEFSDLKRVLARK